VSTRLHIKVKSDELYLLYVYCAFAPLYMNYYFDVYHISLDILPVKK